MEPITHFLTGACIGRAGLNRKTAYATLTAVLAAEAADIDMLWGFAGPVEELKHHRGITHTFLFAPVVAAAAVGVVWLLHRWFQYRHRRKLSSAPPSEPGAPQPRPPQPVRWAWVYLAALLSAFSHILLDWTNNYGVRPFFPFNPRWYAGSFVFIADPVLWALLGSALLFPWLFGLTDREIGARRQPFRGQGWAIFALCGMVFWWGLRWTQHAAAEAMLQANPVTSAPILRMAAEPYPFSPFRWHAILETPGFYQTAEINTRTGDILSDPESDVLFKPRDTPAVEAAKRTFLGRVYLDWGRWAVVSDVGQEPVSGIDPPQLTPGRTWTTVEFTDLRFAYSFRSGARTAGPPPLSGFVYIIDGHEEAGEAMNGREQK
ncbi:MAG TPA: metal-dependent hydrolase [Terracidiphilus sp.]|nr:metal-dependent hydrolase [Terracidiphilus sp.]